MQLPLFVFGTLRRGCENHHYLAQHYDDCQPAVLPGFRRAVAAHGYPAAIPCTGEQVDGELFILRAERYAETLAACDRLEDLPPGELVGEFYQRAEVTVQTATGPVRAWAYIAP